MKTMKTVCKILLAMVLVMLTGVIFAAVKDTILPNPHTINPNDIPIGGSLTTWITWGIGVLWFLYEVIERCIPTASNNSIMHWVGVILDFVAGIFNGGNGNMAKLPGGGVGSFKSTPTPLKK